ncbi:MAG: hypothetical protein Roseis2KO_42620 [Roseivirga sp.]
MNKASSDHRVINRLSKTVLLGRVLLMFLIPGLFLAGGFSPGELWVLIYILSPLTVVYFVSFIRFAVKYPYTVEQAKLGRNTSQTGVVFSVMLHAGYAMLILINAFYKQSPDFDLLSKLLFVGELAGAVFIGTYLSFLFEIRDSSGE